MGRTGSGLVRAGLTRIWSGWRAALVDLAVWLVTAVAVLVRHEPAPGWLLAGELTAAAGVVLLARGWPLPGLAAGTVLAVVDVSCAPVLVLAGYLTGRRLPGSRAALVTLAALGVAASALAPVLAGSAWAWLDGALLLLFAGVVPWLAGRYRRQRQDLVHAGWEQAELLERAQQSIAAQARLRERARIAQDMHDSLGHELSLIALRAGALEVAPEHAECCRAAAGELRVSATRATERLREIIGVLREPDAAGAENAPRQPGGESIAELVARARASGMVVDLREHHADPAPDSGAGPAAADAVPLLVDRAAHRVVQEALTNATKHAPGAPVTVLLTRSAEHTEVRVSNPAPPRVGPLPGLPGGQRGLIGLRERVRLVGGSFQAGPTADGQGGPGFAVAAWLPHHPSHPVAPAGAQATDTGAADSGAIDTGAADSGSDGAGSVRTGAVGAGSGGGTESGQHLARSRQRVRRSLIALVAAPAAVLAAIAGLTTVILVADRMASRLAPDDYARISVGQQRAAIAPLLPAEQRTERPPVLEPPVPADATCEYYGTSGNPFDLPSDVYRLCFTGDVLVAKDLVPGDGPPLQQPARGGPTDSG
ncbi:histidine kinase [Goodfellowiella coeruleoviolacea]|uniref:histidine kinase n=1 Tax=Goodfellowiella coeruleoviolacea TaxID=334858 RepID=A0AAE3GEY6_9PSEU|nr:histidine kinase [Goodfellowiella coeruleoviolacea]MCP2166079.1 Signal transduction histidine kinase [Goodfellowiella coeruleoviolacea]